MNLNVIYTKLRVHINNIRAINLKTVYSLLLPLLIIVGIPIAMQQIHLDSSHNYSWWIQHFRQALVINVFIVFFVYLFFYLIANSTFYASAALMLMSFLFFIIDSQKMDILHQPFLPADLLFVRQALYIAKLYYVPVTGLLLLCIVLFMLLFKAGRYFTHFPFPGRLRIATLVVYFSAAAVSACNLTSVTTAINRRWDLTDIFWNQITNYQKNGVFYAFLMNTSSLGIDKPRNYTRTRIDALFSPFCNNDSVISQQPDISPDVIIVLSESFWDITTIDEYTLSCDPLQHFHQICKSNPSTRLLTPTFGGNTSVAEFEVLTGFPHAMFPAGTIAYNQFITCPIPSLVHVFNENGYKTTGIHTFNGWFWNRRNVYKHLGFNEFITRETMNNAEIKGTFISDMELARQIISVLSDSRQPSFIFALSMQNHGPYTIKRYDSLDCRVRSNIANSAEAEINTYLQGLVDADRCLHTLCQYVDTASKPTLLYFFGDHLPGFTNIYSSSETMSRLVSDTLVSHTTPSVWYANYPLHQLPDAIIPMYFLPLHIARQADVISPVYYHLLDSLQTLLPSSDNIRKNPMRNGPLPDQLAVPEALKLCLYDVLLGKRYSSRYHSISIGNK